MEADEQGRKLMSCCQSQELSQPAGPAPDWLFTFRQPIRSQIASLTELLTLTRTPKFPAQVYTELRDTSNRSFAHVDEEIKELMAEIAPLQGSHLYMWFMAVIHAYKVMEVGGVESFPP